MTTHTERTRAWLDQQSIVSVAEHLRGGYRPLYASGDRIGHMPVGHVVALARTCAILNALTTVEFDSCLDVGSGMGRLGHLIQQLSGARCVGVDLSRELALSVRRDFGFPVHVANAAALPFADAQFDLVLCSEVIEHVEHPFAVLAELVRVARSAVVITTQEVCRNPWQRRLQMAAAEQRAPHAERNYFLADDFRRVLGASVEIQPLLQLPERIRLFPLRLIADLAVCLRALTVNRTVGPGSFGVLVIARKNGKSVVPRQTANVVLQAVLDTDRWLDGLMARRAANPLDEPAPAADVPVLGTPAPICPECGGALTLGAEAVSCVACRRVFPAPQGVPWLLGSPSVVGRNDRRWAERREVLPVRRALDQRPLPVRWMRRALRWAVKVSDFLRLPLPLTDKARLAWCVLRR